MVSLRSHGATGMNAHLTGGALISTSFVVTAAFYMTGRADDSLDIAMGMVDLLATPEQLEQSVQIIRNPAFDIQTRQNE